MLAIQRKQDETTAVKVNILPAKIQYDGPVGVEGRYWQPEHAEDGKNKAYFRGRELDGNVIKLPEGYKGSVLRVTGEVLQTQRSGDSQDGDEADMDDVVEETKAAEELGTFDEVTIWNHDVPWDAAEDSYAKGIGEWISFANAIHSRDSEQRDVDIGQPKSG